ncbi:MAG: 3-hydroxybutyrate dehydrogenase [Planctomycetota bacterium]|jgi:3-hydroxybutyrate dehydrogenase
MQERIMLITGAGSGIGQGLAEHAARDAWHVIVTDLNGHAADEVARAIVAAGGRADAFELDVTRPNSIQRLMDALAGRRVDVLINNAGLQHVANLEDFPQDKWDLLVRVMLNGACMMTRAILPGMKLHGFGRIVNMGSIHSLVASPFKSAYVSAKHGLLGFSKVIALETARTDVTINTICPSYVRTPLVDQQIANQAKEHGISEDEVIREIMLEPMPKGAFISMEELYGIVHGRRRLDRSIEANVDGYQDREDRDCRDRADRGRLGGLLCIEGLCG